MSHISVLIDKYIYTEVSTHPYTQYPLLTVKDNVPVDTDSAIHKLSKSLGSIVCGADRAHRTSSRAHHILKVENKLKIYFLDY